MLLLWVDLWLGELSGELREGLGLCGNCDCDWSRDWDHDVLRYFGGVCGGARLVFIGHHQSRVGMDSRASSPTYNKWPISESRTLEKGGSLECNEHHLIDGHPFLEAVRLCLHAVCHPLYRLQSRNPLESCYSSCIGKMGTPHCTREETRIV